MDAVHAAAHDQHRALGRLPRPVPRPEAQPRMRIRTTSLAACRVPGTSVGGGTFESCVVPRAAPLRGRTHGTVPSSPTINCEVEGEAPL